MPSIAPAARAVLIRSATLAALLHALAGCTAITPVLPWQKGVLAKPEMSFEVDRLEAAFTEHIYSSKEAAAGGSGVGGGGCGCN
jgi:hypothetical protein